jgi:hypothetical protein
MQFQTDGRVLAAIALNNLGQKAFHGEAAEGNREPAQLSGHDETRSAETRLETIKGFKRAREETVAYWRKADLSRRSLE